MNSRAFFLFSIVCSELLFSCRDKRNPATTVLLADTLKRAEAINPYAANDQSPMDMSYYPPEYPILKMNNPDALQPLARVIYSRPQKKGRIIFGYTSNSLRPYGKAWRLGANEASEIEFFQDVIVDARPVKKGRYIIYCIPYPERWTIILNGSLFTWGLHIDQSKDIFKADVPTAVQSPPLEDFTIVFQQAAYGADLLMSWDNIKAVLPIKMLNVH